MQFRNNIIPAYLKIVLYSAAFIIISNAVLAAKADSLFQSDDIINIELRSDFSAIQIDRAGNPEYHDGELIYYSESGVPVSLSVRVMARGNFRRDPANCDFPPLFVNFKKNEVSNTLFDNQDKIKLVTPCQKEEDVIEEYIIYKMYNLVSDQSMKVRLANILYYDTGSSKELFSKYSFFIEEKEHAAERNNAYEKDVFMTPYGLNRQNVKNMAVFQYMIGNNEWFITTRHNVIIMQPEDKSVAPFAIPYDFDFAAFVNADYTKPKGVPEDLLKNRRVYKGICLTQDELENTFDLYRRLRPEFESVINNMSLVSKSSRRQMIKYIDRFYVVINSSALIKREFLDVCETKADYNIAE